MKVSEIEPLDKRRSRITLDDGRVFVLYRGEIRRYHLEAGGEIGEELYAGIVGEVLKKRARERSLYYLRSSPKTEQEIRRKLREGYYPDEVIGDTIAFLKKYRFIDDEEYVRSYLEIQGKRKSLPEISRNLAARGISRELMRSVMSEMPRDTAPAILETLRKRHVTQDAADPELRKKTVNYLVRRGFSCDEIRKAAPWLFGDETSEYF